jgi:hypothetical protein
MPEPTPTAPTPEPTPPADPASGDPPPDPDDQFTSDRQRRRFAELTGRVGVRERERDEARACVEQLLEREVLRVAATTLSEPRDVFLDGATVADLLGDDGSDVDPAKVSAVVAALVAKRPGLQKQPEVRPLSGIHGPQMPIGERPPSLADAMRRVASGRDGII